MCNKLFHSIIFQTWKSVQQCDPVSAYLFMLCLEIFFKIAKNHKEINSYHPTYSLCWWRNFFFFLQKKLGSIKELLNTISLFSVFSGLKPNLSKCEVTRIGLLIGVYGIKCINLTKDAIKILGIFFQIMKLLN